MTPNPASDPTARAETIFHAVVDLPTGERAAHLDSQCDGDGKLRRRVERLLAEHDRGLDSFLENPPIAGMAAVPEPMPERIGQYEVTEKLGEGGCGVVYLAQQSRPVRREVAVKVLRVGVNTRQVVARFEAERQVLAMMDHPHIATVYDAGMTTDGRPYFVMERVDGVPLLDYCQQGELALRQRVSLFVAVCHAIEHAHRRGIIHRDLKPSNILVTQVNDQAAPKVIDFGIAKAIGGSPTEMTLVTETGQLMGTPQYMSPEQCTGRPDAVDTRSDVYSLGVVLYQLLTGRLPYDLDGTHLFDIPRIVREDPARRPSTFNKLLRGDLETVLLKALDKDRNRRYASVEAFRGDLEHFLANRPIEARRDSPWYVLKKTISRHRVAAMALAGFVLLATGTVVGLSYLYQQSETNATALRESLYVNAISNAEQAYAAGNVGTMKSALAEAPVALRGWEWHHLNRLTDGSLLHFPDARGAAISPDGSLVAATRLSAELTSENELPGTLTIYDGKTGAELHTLTTDDTAYPVVTFSPTGALVAVGGIRYHARIWDAATGEIVLELPTDNPSRHRASEALAFSPDGRLLLTGGRPPVVYIWEVATGTHLAELTGHSERVHGIAVSRDSRLVATSDSSGMIRLWDLETAELLSAQKVHQGMARGLNFDVETKRLFSCGWDRWVCVADVESGEIIDRWGPFDERIDGLAITDGGLAAVATPARVELRSVANGSFVRRLIGHDGAVSGVSLSTDGTRLLSHGEGGPRVWDTARDPTRFVTAKHNGIAEALACSPCGRWIVGAGCDKVLRIFDAKTYGVVSTRQIGTSRPKCVAFSPDGDLLAYPEAEGREVHIVRVPDGDVVTTLRHDAYVVSLDWSLDGSKLAAGSEDCRIAVWDLGNKRILSTVEGHHKAALSPDGTKLLTFNSAPRGTVISVAPAMRLWDASTGDLLRVFETDDSKTAAAAWTRNGQRIVTGDEQNRVRVWDAEDGQCLATLAGHTNNVAHVAVSPDDNRIASASYDHDIIVWDLTRYRKLLTLKGHTDIAAKVAFTPDGHKIVSTSADGTVRVWDGTPSTDPHVTTGSRE